MRIIILAIGQSRTTPEATLVQDYCTRAQRTGQAVGLTQIAVHECDKKKNTNPTTQQQDEHKVLSDYLAGAQGLVVALDETGKNMTSRAFANQLQGWLDEAVPQVTFVLGGADGLHPDMRQRADMVLALGTMTWPHLLARALLAEQIWRGVSILTNHPYHRDAIE